MTTSNPTTPERPAPHLAEYRWHTLRELIGTASPASGTGSASHKSASSSSSASSTPSKRARSNSDPFIDQHPNLPSRDGGENEHCSSSPPAKPTPAPTFPTRIKSTITHNEYCVIGTLYSEIKKAPAAVLEWFDKLGTPDGVRREYLSLKALTGVGEKTCRNAILMARGVDQTPPATVRTGRPVMDTDESTGNLIQSVVEQINREGSASSLKEVKRRLKDQFQMIFSLRTLHRRMTELGCYWGAGTRINKNHDSEANVRYRRKYVRRRLENLKAILNKKTKETMWIPEHPEVFLDESYCHLDHNSRNRWVIPGSVTVEPGHSPLLVIFAAFVVWYDKKDKEIKAKFVDESVYIWPSIGKAHTKDGTGANNAEAWNKVPQFVKDAGVVAPTADYHGNFTAEVFDALFTRICENLVAMKLFNCRIHLDGASYHFHKSAAKPAGKVNLQDLKDWAQRPEVQVWLNERGYVIPEKPKKADIQKFSKEYVEKSTWTIYDIARRTGGHIIRKTPPYHCELQPIEKIWACVKNRVAATTDGRHTIISLKQTLDSLFTSIPQSTFLSVWNGSIEECRKYLFEDDDEEENNNNDKANNPSVPAKAIRSDNDAHLIQYNQPGASFDTEAELGSLQEIWWTMTLNTVVNQDILFDSTPTGHNNDEEAGVDPAIDEEEEMEEEVEEEEDEDEDDRLARTRRRQAISIPSLINLTNEDPLHSAQFE